MRKLTIISHTEHYKSPDGSIVGLGSTVTEINHLLEIFDEIVHVAMFYDTLPPPSSLPYISDRIKFIPIPAVGGTDLKSKFTILGQAPKILNRVRKTLRQTDYFQFRAPTGIGVFVVPYLVLFSSKKGWFKYAGNWNQKNPPLAYSFQRWLLKNQKRKVTINGKWPEQPRQCLTFENPCLTDSEVIEGQEVIREKLINNKLIHFCFVGRLEEEKGVGLLINAFNRLSKEEKARIGKIHLVGDGRLANFYKEMAREIDLNFVFHGFLSRNNVQTIYKESHAIILPSASEGFPKVIAEALNFGCLPIVSNISAIGDYIKNNTNGYLLDSITVENLVEAIKMVLNLKNDQYNGMVSVQRKDVEKFTYAYYNRRIVKDLLD